MAKKPYQEKRLTPAMIAVVLVGVVIIIIGILGALGVFHKNPYGSEIKIDNYNDYIKGSPQDTKDATFTALYNAVKVNTNDSSIIPKDGAIIREDSFTSTLKDDDIHFDTFMVDIEGVRQSYYAQITWSDDKDADLGGYPILFTCPTKEQLIYPEFDCQDLLTLNPVDKLYSQNPITYLLPIVVSYRDNDNNLVSYRISYKAIDNNSKIKLVINDYTGGNYERAIQTLKDNGVTDPEQYEIEYIDDSEEIFTPPTSSHQP